VEDLIYDANVNPASPIFGCLGVQRQPSFVGAHSARNDIKGLGWFVGRNRSPPFFICFRFASHALLRIFILAPVLHPLGVPVAGRTRPTVHPLPVIGRLDST